MKLRPAGTLLYALLCLVLALILLGGQRYYWPQIADDSFIFFRYARHLAEGHGLAWNVGEPLVEGYSSPLWVLLLAAASAAGADPVPAAKLLGTLFFLGAVGGCGLLAHRISGKRWFPLAAMGAVAALEPLHYWAPSGMETSLYAFVLVWAAVAIPSRHERVAGLALGVVGIARPEGPLLVVGALAALAVLRRRSGLGPFLRVAVPAALVTGAYLVFRLAVFHDLLPNTYYAKAGGPAAWRLRMGVDYVHFALPLWLALTVFVVLLLRRRAAAARVRETAALAWVFITLDLVAIVWGGGDWMWHYRFLGPLFTLAIPAALGASRALARLPARLPWGVLGCLLAAAFVALALLGVGLVGAGEVAGGLAGKTMPRDWAQEGTLTIASREVADFLRSAAGPDAIIAVNHAGAVPYYSGLRTVDMTGLNDRHIARGVEGGLHHKYDPAYVLGRRPEFIVLNSRVRPSREGWYVTGYWEGETALVLHPEFQANYAFLPRYWSWTWQSPPMESYILVARRVPAPRIP